MIEILRSYYMVFVVLLGLFIVSFFILLIAGCCKVSGECSRKEEEDEIKELFEK